MPRVCWKCTAKTNNSNYLLGSKPFTAVCFCKYNTLWYSLLAWIPPRSLPSTHHTLLAVSCDDKKKFARCRESWVYLAGETDEIIRDQEEKQLDATSHLLHHGNYAEAVAKLQVSMTLAINWGLHARHAKLPWHPRAVRTNDTRLEQLVRR